MSLAAALFWISAHRYALPALGLAALGVAARIYVPAVGKPIATALWIAAAAGLAYDAGYALRARQDRSAALAAQLEELRRDAAANQAIAAAAQARAVAAEAARRSDDENADQLQDELAEKDADCALSDDERRQLQAIGADQPQPAGAAADVRPAGRRPALVKPPGTKAALGRYRAALAEANRRLRADQAFYDDVRRRFGAGGATR